VTSRLREALNQPLISPYSVQCCGIFHGMNTTKSQLVGPHQLGRQLRLPADWLVAEAQAGRLPHVNARGRYLFNPEAVTQVLAARATHEGLGDAAHGTGTTCPSIPCEEGRP